MRENKIIAAALTTATSGRELRGSSDETGAENWRVAFKNYEQILDELDRDSIKKAT